MKEVIIKSGEKILFVEKISKDGMSNRSLQFTHDGIFFGMYGKMPEKFTIEIRTPIVEQLQGDIKTSSVQ